MKECPPTFWIGKQVVELVKEKKSESQRWESGCHRGTQHLSDSPASCSFIKSLKDGTSWCGQSTLRLLTPSSIIRPSRSTNCVGKKSSVRSS